MFKNKKNREKASLNGFTLIEVLIVIAIIGILAGIGVFQAYDAKQKAKNAAIAVEINSLRLAEELIYSERGSYIDPALAQADASSDVERDIKRVWDHIAVLSGGKQESAVFDASGTKQPSVDSTNTVPVSNNEEEKGSENQEEGTMQDSTENDRSSGDTSNSTKSEKKKTSSKKNVAWAVAVKLPSYTTGTGYYADSKKSCEFSWPEKNEPVDFSLANTCNAVAKGEAPPKKPSTPPPVVATIPPVTTPIPETPTETPVPDIELPVFSVPSFFGTGKVWQVGPTRQYKKPSDVVALVQDGDTVEIDSAVYRCDTSVKWRANNLTLRGVGGRPHLDAKGCSISGGKAIWNPGGKNLLIDNIEFSGAKVSDTNGAGIRYDGGGEVIIRNSYFHDNENGILFTPLATKYNRDEVSLLIEYSKFSKNGYSDGKSHNFYIQKIGTFTFRYNVSESSKAGHLVKTRAKKNFILYNRLTQLDGTGSYEIDISEGGETYIIGNVIQQGANSENRGIVAYAGEGRNAVALDGTLDREMKLYFINNTIINDNPGGSSGINLYDYGVSEVVIANNLVTGLTESRFVNYRNPEKNTASKTTFLNNVITESPGFNDRNQYSYYLTASSPAINAGTAIGVKNSVDLKASQQYIHEARVEPRPVNGVIDAGAYEYDGRIITKPTLSLNLSTPQIPYNTTATISWNSENTLSCTASGAWSGIKQSSGAETVGPFTADTKFSLNCAGIGGSVETEVTLLVSPNPELANYPEYEFIQLPNTKLRSICNESGDLRGTVGCSTLNGNLIATYDSKRNTVYFWQGGLRNYWGNGVSALNLNTKTIARATEPTEPKSVVGYTGANYNMITPCNGVWALTDGTGAVPAPINSYSAFLYLPDIDRVASLGGKVACGVSTFADKGWFFNPSTSKWDLKYQTSPVADVGANGFLDTETNTVILGNTKGIYRYDYRANTFTSLGGTTPSPWSVGSTVDPRNKLWLFLGGSVTNNSLPVLDISNLSSGPLPTHETSWKVTGDTQILKIGSPGVAYDPVNKLVVGWRGDGKIYFIEPDKTAKAVTILGYPIRNSPIANNVSAAHKFMYIPSLQAFLVFAGIDQDMYLLKSTGKKINLSTP